MTMYDWSQIFAGIILFGLGIIVPMILGGLIGLGVGWFKEAIWSYFWWSLGIGFIVGLVVDIFIYYITKHFTVA